MEKFIAELEVEDRKFEIKRPNKKQKEDIDLLYRKIFFANVRNGISTQAEALKHIRAQNIWTDEDDKKRANLIQEILLLEDELGKRNLPKEAQRKKAVRLGEARDDLIRMNLVIQAILSNTAEQRAKDVIYLHYIWSLLQEKDVNRRYFLNIETFDAFEEYADLVLNEVPQELDEQQKFDQKLITEALVGIVGWVNDVSADAIRNPLESQILQELADEEAQPTELVETESQEPAQNDPEPSSKD